MTIQFNINNFNIENLTAVVDYQTHRSLTHGTEFQKSMVILALLNRMLMDVHKEELESLNLSAKAHQEALDKIDIFCKIILKDNPLPGIDPDALEIFCG
ncbi:MAG: hypothetical protein U1E26_02745 [Coriobacteriia bacterium]|nr:hypothetical protein [Methylobacter sp.]MDP2427019.1 hypothetical protein [Methylobacter sp.]MDP3055019.1 hypothetical protein [Methylobacter sp.]MDZ4168562.1 hypothetical protein [Coriobacteriia bacterium]